MVEKWIKESTVCVALNADDELVGCAHFPISTDGNGLKKADLGPIAVSVQHQRQGFGVQLLQEVARRAKALECDVIEITVVNHRTDLFPFYEKHNFVYTGEEVPFDREHGFDESELTRSAKLIIMHLKL